MGKILISMKGLDCNIYGVIFLLWLASSGITMASTDEVLSLSEQRYRIALLLGLVKFGRWPSSAFSNTTEPFTLCLLGSDATIQALAQIEGTKVRGREIKLRYFKRIAGLSAQNKCHLFYIARSNLNPLPAILRLFSDFPVLTISDQSKFAEKGGAVEFIRDTNKNQFIVNLSAIERANLKISAQLLGMGKIIRK